MISGGSRTFAMGGSFDFLVVEGKLASSARTEGSVAAVFVSLESVDKERVRVFLKKMKNDVQVSY
jgi:hypothetical protein